MAPFHYIKSYLEWPKIHNCMTTISTVYRTRCRQQLWGKWLDNIWAMMIVWRISKLQNFCFAFVVKCSVQLPWSIVAVTTQPLFVFYGDWRSACGDICQSRQLAYLLLFGCQYQCNRLSGKTCLWNDLLCVEWDIKPYTLTHYVSLCIGHISIGMWRSQEKFAFIEYEFHKTNPFKCECECEFNYTLTCLW